MANFNEAINFTLGNEGSTFTNNPLDPGKATKYGITRVALGEFHNKSPDLITDDEIMQLTPSIVDTIYKELYWNRIQLDNVIDQDVATVMLDASVVLGQPTLVKIVQYYLAPLAIDGVMGPKTLERINSSPINYIIKSIMNGSLNRYANIIAENPSQIVFFPGWCNRVLKYINFLQS